MKPVKARNPESSSRLWDQYGELLVRIYSGKANLDKAERDIRALIHAAEQLPAESSPGFLKNAYLACCWGVLGHCLRLQRKWGSAVEARRTAVRLDPENAHHLENLVDLLLEQGRFEEAATHTNAVSIDTLSSEEESTAVKILNWAVRHPEFAVALSADVLRHCVLLVARTSKKRGWLFQLTRSSPPQLAGGKTSEASR
jgi:hypothetical protein